MLCLPSQVFYNFSFWLMFRQQLKEKQEEHSLKEESLDEVKVMQRNLFLDCFNKYYGYCVIEYIKIILTCTEAIWLIYYVWCSSLQNMLNKNVSLLSLPIPLSVSRLFRGLFLPFLILSLLCFLYLSGRKSAITSGSDADLRSERDAGEILDPLLLLHVLCHQLLWKGIDRQQHTFKMSSHSFCIFLSNLFNTAALCLGSILEYWGFMQIQQTTKTTCLNYSAEGFMWHMCSFFFFFLTTCHLILTLLSAAVVTKCSYSDKLNFLWCHQSLFLFIHKWNDEESNASLKIYNLMY